MCLAREEAGGADAAASAATTECPTNCRVHPYGIVLYCIVLYLLILFCIASHVYPIITK